MIHLFTLVKIIKTSISFSISIINDIKEKNLESMLTRKYRFYHEKIKHSTGI